MPGIHTEQTFEEAIEQELLTNGSYIKGSPEDFDREIAIDKKTLISFLKTSQLKEWQKLENIHGPSIEDNVINRIIKVINNQGCLEVIRKGFTDYGVNFKMAFFKPETGLNPIPSGYMIPTFLPSPGR